MSKLTFWGVQGGCAGSSLNDTYGTNTPCVSIEHNDNLIIFDSGTGIRILSESLKQKNYKKVVLILTHSHWDHIQGFPFFSYLFKKGHVHIFTVVKTHYKSLLSQINGINFPLNRKGITCNLTNINTSKEFKDLTGLTIKWIKTNHHRSCFGYRLLNKSIDITYIPDNQLMDNRKNKVSFNIFKSFCKNTNLLIHDSQYSNQDMPEKKFWGHSLFTDTLKLSLEANVKHSYLFHHDPNKNKSEINKMVAYCNKQSRYTKFYPAIEKESINLLDN